jgi:hypothetical protein
VLRCRQAPIETQFQGDRIFLEHELDGSAGQGLGLTVEGMLRPGRSGFSIPARASAAIAGPRLCRRPLPLFLLFFHKIISDRYRPFRTNPRLHVL